MHPMSGINGGCQNLVLFSLWVHVSLNNFVFGWGQVTGSN